MLVLQETVYEEPDDILLTSLVESDDDFNAHAVIAIFEVGKMSGTVERERKEAPVSPNIPNDQDRSAWFLASPAVVYET